MDILAREGVRFDRAYVDCPVCIPARTTLVTGKQAHRYGRPNFDPPYRIQRDREQFLGSLMTRAGYQTELIGKRHWHTEPTFRAGFEHVISEKLIVRDRLLHTGRLGNPAGIGANEFTPRLSGYPADLCFSNWVVNHACDFLEYRRDQTQPFFLWVSTIDPHPPNVIHEPYYSMYDNEPVPDPIVPDWSRNFDDLPYALAFHRKGNAHHWMNERETRKARGVYYGMITNLDDQIARLFGALHKADVFENTWIIYTSDHGEHLGDYGDWSKSTFLDPSARVPLIVRPPADQVIERGVVSDEIVQWADLLPTICAIGGAETPDDVDGIDLTEACRGGSQSVRDELHGQIADDHMLLTDRWKYLYFAEDGREMLFDIQADPRDEHDLSSDAALVEPMRKRLIAHLEAEGNDACKDGKLVNRGMRIEEADRPSMPSGWMGWTLPSC